MGIRAVYRKTGIVAAVATVLLGWLLLFPLQPLHPPNPLVRWSYDFLQLVLPQYGHTDLVIIYMDEQARRDQKPGQPWPRSIHAGLLGRLARDQPKVVVFDVTMTQASNSTEDDDLARAIRENGRVVLAGDKVPVHGVPLSYNIDPPLEQFETNAAGWGTVKVPTDPDGVGRRYDAGDAQYPGLAWAAAKVAGAPVTRNAERRLAEVRWLNYYGSGHPFASLSMSYTDTETSERGFFTGKAVFIGGSPETPLRDGVPDVFDTPFTKWNSRLIPGVELTAIAYANLMHDDWLRRMGIFAELGLLLVTGAGAAFGLQRVRLRTAVWLALSMAVLLIAGSIALVLFSWIWFSWVVVALVQLPCAVMFRLFADRDAIPAAPLEADPGQATTAPDRELPATIQDGRPEIADHTLIRCIGEGAYGQVWIARNAIGLYHAVKVVYRNRFGTGAPFERALRGIHKFMPVSRSHEGFVHILHVGRNDRAGFFFYIMEAGDDETAGQQIDPATYAPKTLASELRARETIPPRECLEFMLAVTEAADRLHQHQLIHRDIKPANIIFVNHRPKLADIDLVTDLSAQGDTSRIGTEGYMAPEGPGSAAADVFSLGRILYVALTGKPPDQCPELPTQVTNRPDCGLFLELNHIICKACELDLGRRYSSAALMHADLLEVFQRLDK